MANWSRTPFFWLGLALRVFAIWALLAAGGPFPTSGISSDRAFPTGPVGSLLIAPLAGASALLGLPTVLGSIIVLLLADVGMLLGLQALLSFRKDLLLKVYWLSPLPLVAAYVGFASAELLGAALFCWGLVAVRRSQASLAAVLAVGAAATSLSGAFALPLFFFYYFRNRALRSQLRPFAVAAALAAATFAVIQLLLDGYDIPSAIDDPWTARFVAMVVPTANGLQPLYVFPIVYALSLFVVWRMRRLAPDVFPVLCGLLFLVISLFTGNAPSWLLWALPLLVFVQSESGAVAIGLINLLAVLYVLSGLPIAVPFAQSAAVATCLVVVASIWKYTVQNNDLLRIGKRPLVIGIAGDSGAGKDTLVDSIAKLFDSRSVVRLSGDNYHFWDRHKPMWQVMTHLNPRANDLEKFARDLVALVDGKGIVAPHYDHGSGRKSRPMQIRSNDFIIASGLHALYLPMMRECYDLSIYLDIDEGLRRFLKLERDVKQRGHDPQRVLSSMADRQADASQFIRPQRDHAGLVMSLCPVNPKLLDGATDPSQLRLKLVVRSHQGFHEENLVRALVGICGLQVDMTLGGDDASIVLSIEGETHADDIALASKTLVPQLLPLLRSRPHWEDGVKGLMQLVVLAHLNQAMRRRLL